MRDGNNKDIVPLNRVKHGVGENPNSAAAHICFEHTPALRRMEYLLYCRPHFAGETRAQGAPAILVVKDSFCELLRDLWMELVPHLASRSSMRR